MRKKIRNIFFILIIVNLLGCGPKDKREKPPGVGEKCPDIKVDYQLSSQDAQHLGITSRKEFNFREISGDLIILEVLNVYCANCRTQTTVMNELYYKIQNEPDLKDKIKILAIAAGNQEWETEFFKKTFDVPYPVIPDSEYEITNKLGVFKTPFHLIIRKTGDEMVVAQSHQGILDNVNAYYENLTYILTFEISAFKQLKGKESTKPVKPLGLVISEEELLSLVKKGMSEREWKILDIKRIKLKNEEIVFMGSLQKSSTTKKLFAKAVSRDSLCDTCEDVHFIYIFDEKGRIVTLVPILLAKDGNVLWDENDLGRIKGHIVGKYIYEQFDFDAKVDAISTATITSALIFDSLERADMIYRELKKKGYVN